MSAVKIKVKPWHIGRGEMGEVYSCPIALAARKQLKLSDVEVDGETIAGTNLAGDIVIYRLSRAAQRFVTKFDALGKKAVQAFNFFAFPK